MIARISASEITGDSRLEGVVYTGGCFYISGANYREAGDQENKIFIINQNNELIGQFDQPGESHYGLRDLAWDGELIWGSGDRTIYGFTTEGEVQNIIEYGPFSTHQAIAWDNDRELLWASGIASNYITGLTRDGVEVANLDRHRLRIYGFGYWRDDPDNCPLYILHGNGENKVLYKMNPDIGDTIFVANLNSELAGRAGGIFISNQWDVYSWVLMSLINNSGDDRIDIWHLGSRMDWIAIEPQNGIIPARDSEEFQLTFNSTDLIPAIYRNRLEFRHDGIGGRTDVDLTLIVSEEIRPDPPMPFSLLFPENNSRIFSDNIEFTWQKSDDPDPNEIPYYVFWMKSGRDSISTESMRTVTTLSDDNLGINVHLGSPLTWWVKAISGDDTVECVERFTFEWQPMNEDDVSIEPPHTFGIQSLYPNPFNSKATISYSIPEAGLVKLHLYDLTGRMVREIVNSPQSAGIHKSIIDGKDLASGVFLVMLESSGSIERQKVVMVK